MSKKKRDKPFKSRWRPMAGTIELARANVAKLPANVIEELKTSFQSSIKDLMEPSRSAVAWLDLRFACLVSKRIEKMGVVTGLAPNLNDAYEALERLREANLLPDGQWLHSEPSASDIEIFEELSDAHLFQLSHLSQSEFERAFKSARSEAATLPKVALPARHVSGH